MKIIRILSLVAICLFSFKSFAQISGVVFRDFNANGVKDNTTAFNEPFVQGVTVKAFNAAGMLVGTTTSASNGSYAFVGLTLPTRIEFSDYLPGDFPGPLGTANLSSIQFYTAATTSANFAVNYPSHYCQQDPSFVTPKYKNVAVNSFASMVKAPYTATGNNNPGIQTNIALKSDIGITWGTAYSRKNAIIYTSAFVKRHVGSSKDNNTDGKEDIGAIYTVTPTGTSALWLDLGTLSGVDVGLSQMPTIAQRGLNTTNVSDWSYDDLVFDKIGKIGLGDLEISDDETKLYVVNLFQSKLYTIDIATKAIIGTGTIPNNCSGGNLRAFGLKYFRGNLYVGTVCDAFASQSATNLTATVYKYDGVTFTNVLSFPLNYAKGPAFINGPPAGPAYGGSWKPWTDDATFATQFAFTASNGNPAVVYCQPILADIEFDSNEDMILTFNDRFGHQTGANNLRPDPSHSNTTLYTNVAGGDILRASWVSGAYVLESNGTSGSVSTSGVGNNQGPGGGEFYVGDESLMYHQESVTGGSMLLAGKNEVVVNVIDPLNFWAEGPRWLNNTTGAALRSYEIRPTTGEFSVQDGGKANGLGDLELLCNAAPIEIGNRVWMDTDKDGVQDADEMGLDGISVKLYSGATLIATKTTANGGQYSFGTADGVLPNTAYTLRIEAAGFPSGKFVTLKDQPTGGVQDLGDNDASLVGGNADISYTTGNPGENNHTLDFGFSAAPVSNCSPDSIKICAGQSAELVGLDGLSNYKWYIINAPGDTVQVGTGQTFTTTVAGNYIYKATNGAGCPVMLCCQVTVANAICCSIMANATQPPSCDDNGTLAISTDDRIKFSLNATNTGTNTTYLVTVNQGSVSPSVGTYGQNIAFTMQPGSAGQGDVIVTLTDSQSPSCTNQFIVIDPGTCSPGSVCVIDDSGLKNITCNDNGTPSTAIDDYTTFTLNPTGIGNLDGYTVLVLSNGFSVTPTAAKYGADQLFTLNSGSASAKKIKLKITDTINPDCSFDIEVLSNGTCSNCTNPPCVPINVIKN